MKNLYDNLLEKDEINNIFYDFEIKSSKENIFNDDIYINIKYNDRIENYRIYIKNENIYIELIEENEKIDIFSMNYIQFEDDLSDDYISNIIYSFFKNRYEYIMNDENISDIDKMIIRENIFISDKKRRNELSKILNRDISIEIYYYLEEYFNEFFHNYNQYENLSEMINQYIDEKFYIIK